MSFNRTLEFLDIKEISYLIDHATITACILNHRTVMHTSKAETTHTRLVACQAPIDAFFQRDQEFPAGFRCDHIINPEDL